MNQSNRFFIVLGALNGFLFVTFGAFGAHGLQTMVSDQQMEWFKTGAHYQGIHAMALVLTGLAGMHMRQLSSLKVAGWAFFLGILLFSGSLYLMALGAPRWFGMVTPFGGTAFMVGWASLLIAALKMR